MHRQILYWVTLASFWLFFSASARADLLDRLNQLRRSDCEPGSGSLPILRRSNSLDEVAVEWSKGSRLTDAVARTTYQGRRLASMQVQGSSREAQIVGALRDNYCDILTDPRYSEVGLFRRNDAVWIVVAAPLSIPGANDAAKIRSRVLQLVNEARGRARKCGGVKFEAAQPLRDSSMLNGAARAHAQDMARHQFFEHEGSDGSTPAVRVTRAGYGWSRVGENIAAGVMSAEELVAGWLASPGHCANIMQPQFTDMGLDYAVTKSGKRGVYWSQVFARPREQS